MFIPVTHVIKTNAEKSYVKMFVNLNDVWMVKAHSIDGETTEQKKNSAIHFARDGYDWLYIDESYANIKHQIEIEGFESQFCEITSVGSILNRTKQKVYVNFAKVKSFYPLPENSQYYSRGARSAVTLGDYGIINVEESFDQIVNIIKPYL